MINGDVDQPLSSGIRHSFFLDSLSVSPSDILNVQSDGNVQNSLETGVHDDAMYTSSLNNVACTNEPCNKRISVAGQRGRQGNRAIRPLGVN